MSNSDTQSGEEGQAATQAATYYLRLVEPAPHNMAAGVDGTKFTPRVALRPGTRLEIKRGTKTSDKVLGMTRHFSTVSSKHGGLENDGGLEP